MHDANNTQDGKQEEAEASEDTNPGSCKEVIVSSGVKQWVETFLVRHEKDALCCQGESGKLRAQRETNNEAKFLVTTSWLQYAFSSPLGIVSQWIKMRTCACF